MNYFCFSSTTSPWQKTGKMLFVVHYCCLEILNVIILNNSYSSFVSLGHSCESQLARFDRKMDKKNVQIDFIQSFFIKAQTPFLKFSSESRNETFQSFGVYQYYGCSNVITCFQTLLFYSIQYRILLVVVVPVDKIPNTNFFSVCLDRLKQQWSILGPCAHHFFPL